MKKFCLLLSYFCIVLQLQAQVEEPVDTVPEVSADRLFIQTLVDTTPVTYFLSGDPSEKFLYEDTSLIDLHYYDPARKRNYDAGTLGNLGSASKNLLYQPLYRQGVDIGLHQFDLYYVRAEELKHFISEKGYTEASFNAGNEQADSYLKVLFSRSFIKGVNLSVEHHRISQQGDSYHFAHQNTKQSVFNIGLAVQPEKSPYRAFLTWAANISEQEENGGILPDSFEVERPFEQSVSTEIPNTRHSHRELLLTQYLGFFGKEDSTGSSRRSYTLVHNGKYSISNYKFWDPAPENADSTFYQHFLTDPRGLRSFIEHEFFENSLAVQTFKAGKKAGDRSDLVEVGVKHQYHIVYQEPLREIKNNLFLTGRLNFRPGKLLTIRTSGYFGLLENVGDYRVEGHVNLNFGKWGQFQGNFINQLYSPSLLEESFYVSQQQVWNNNFNKTLSTSVTGELFIPGLDLMVEGGYHLVNNLVYFDSISYPQQVAVPVNVVQAGIRKNFRLFWFHLDNYVGLQKVSENVIQIPEYFSSHSLYYSDRLFKDKLDTRIGIAARLYGSYFANSYYPVTGQFHNQYESTIGTFPQIDIFVALKVQTFRAFLKFENVMEWFGTDYLEEKFGQRYFYQFIPYPYPATTLRWGVTWRLNG